MQQSQTEEPEDLREYYITPAYLDSMRSRAREWPANFIKEQLQNFKSSIPDYPEVHHLLEGEMHRRNLNQLLRYIRHNPRLNLKPLLEKYKSEPDYIELIHTEMEIRSGVQRLTDTDNSGSARIVT